DLAGSGHETAAHLQHNGRITFMFTSFDPKPNILRLYGRGDVIRPSHPEWETLLAHFDPMPGQRCIVRAHIDSTQDSCGFAVPRYEFIAERETLTKLWQEKGEQVLCDYIANKTESIDGLPIENATQS